MIDLDQQIRAAIDARVMHPTTSYHGLELAGALRAVLAIQHAPSDSIRGRAWNRALEQMRMRIAYQLGITNDPEGATAQPMDGRAEP